MQAESHAFKDSVAQEDACCHTDTVCKSDIQQTRLCVHAYVRSDIIFLQLCNMGPFAKCAENILKK